MKITARAWLTFTTGERMAILEYAVWENQKRWQKK